MSDRSEVRSHLARGIEAATSLGLDTSRAEAIAAGFDGGRNGRRNGAAMERGEPAEPAEPATAPQAAETATAPQAAEAAALAQAAAALAVLGDAAGIHGPVRDLVTERARRRAIDGSVSRLAALLDMEGLEAGALAATRARAGLLLAGPVRPLADMLDGRAHRDPDVREPREHLRDWRSRGDLSVVTELISGAVREALPRMPVPLRPAYEAACEEADLKVRLSASLDKLIAAEEPEMVEPPTSTSSRVFVVLLWLDAIFLAIGAAWTAAVVASGGQAPLWNLPLVGAQPGPLVVLVFSIVAGALLAVGLRRHVDRLGLRWAHRIEVIARIGARTVIESQAFNQVDRLESARLRLANAVRSIAPAGRSLLRGSGPPTNGP